MQAAKHEPASKLYGAAKDIKKSMKPGDLEDFTRSKPKGLPAHAGESLAHPAQIRAILNRLLSEEDMYSPEERQEVQLARTVLDGLRRLQSSLGEPTPEQLHALTGIRAAAQSIIRMHKT